MSGDQLRKYAVMGDCVNLKAILRGGANPCSVDDQGLTALHFATWNGHEEAVHVLVANDRGTDVDTGEHISSLNIQSDSGFTALHLSVSATQDTGVGIAITRYLVLAGADPHIEDSLGRTVRELAEDCNNRRALNFLDIEPPTEEETILFMQAAKAEHLVQTMRVHDYSSLPRDKDGNPIITREDKVPVPAELGMPEHHILPFATKNFKALRQDGASAIRNLVQSVEQSEKNEERREILAHSVEYNLRASGKMNWRPEDASEEAMEKKKQMHRSSTGRRGSIIK